MSTPTGYAPDFPALFNDFAPNAMVAGSQAFTPAAYTPQVVTKNTSRNDSPLTGNGTSFTTIAAPTPKTFTRAQSFLNVPV